MPPYAKPAAPSVSLQMPGRLNRAWFGFRAAGLRLRRALRDAVAGENLAGKHVAPAQRSSLSTDWPVCAGSSRTPLWRLSRMDAAGAGAEWLLTAGKVQNLRVAARRLNGLLVPAGSVFSFWRALGRPVRSRGYVAGRELREGCMVASIAGGLCQLSNALYAAALEAGLPIVERHAHSRIVPGSLAERGLDATVFWNYIDLRFRAPADCVLDVRLDAGHLHVTLRMREALPVAKSAPTLRIVAYGKATHGNAAHGKSAQGGSAHAQAPARDSACNKTHGKTHGKTRDQAQDLSHDHTHDQTHDQRHDQTHDRTHDHAHDCIACEQQDCPEYLAPASSSRMPGHTAWLLDEAWPEFKHWLGTHAQAGDHVALPLDGERRGRTAYAWPLRELPGLHVREHLGLTLARSLGTRLLGAQGAARQRTLLKLDRHLALTYARELSPEADRVVLPLNLLPHLWASGALGGRRYTVLLNRSPLAMLHAQLDRAHALHPQSSTLGDFRADPALVAMEEEALRGAATLVTPHRAVALFCRAQYGVRVEQIDWQASRAATPPRAEPGGAGRVVLFPASALGRKGAYEVREACRELGLTVRVLGQANEADAFWGGVDARVINGGDPWQGVACVALPAFVEHRPRLLLQARSRGLPVVCSEDCGLPLEMPGIHVVRAGAQTEITAALARAAA